MENGLKALTASALIAVASFSAGAASVLVSFNAANPNSPHEGVRRVDRPDIGSRILRDRAPVQHQLTDEERLAIEKANFLRVQQEYTDRQFGNVHEAAPEAPGAEYTLQQLLDRCYAIGFVRSRLAHCIGQAFNGVKYQARQIDGIELLGQ